MDCTRQTQNKPSTKGFAKYRNVELSISMPCGDKVDPIPHHRSTRYSAPKYSTVTGVPIYVRRFETYFLMYAGVNLNNYSTRDTAAPNIAHEYSLTHITYS